jgi:hypothetical protein
MLNFERETPTKSALFLFDSDYQQDMEPNTNQRYLQELPAPNFSMAEYPEK